MIRLTFNDGQVVEYPTGNAVSDNMDSTLKFVLDISGEVVATVPKLDVVLVETLPDAA